MGGSIVPLIFVFFSIIFIKRAVCPDFFLCEDVFSSTLQRQQHDEVFLVFALQNNFNNLLIESTFQDIYHLHH